MTLMEPLQKSVAHKKTEKINRQGGKVFVTIVTGWPQKICHFDFCHL